MGIAGSVGIARDESVPAVGGYGKVAGCAYRRVSGEVQMGRSWYESYDWDMCVGG